MRATKHEFTVRIEVLDKCVIRAMLLDVLKQVENDAYDGLLQYDDGDFVSWGIDSQQVDI
jgi:hypothetical protein